MSSDQMRKPVPHDTEIPNLAVKGAKLTNSQTIDLFIDIFRLRLPKELKKNSGLNKNTISRLNALVLQRVYLALILGEIHSEEREGWKDFAPVRDVTLPVPAVVAYCLEFFSFALASAFKLAHGPKDLRFDVEEGFVFPLFRQWYARRGFVLPHLTAMTLNGPMIHERFPEITLSGPRFEELYQLSKRANGFRSEQYAGYNALINTLQFWRYQQPVAPTIYDWSGYFEEEPSLDENPGLFFWEECTQFPLNDREADLRFIDQMAEWCDPMQTWTY